MQKKGIDKEKVAFFVFAAIILVLTLTRPAFAGYADGSSLITRLAYPLFHANVFHAFANLFVLWQCIKCFNAHWHMLVFYAISITYPFPVDVPIMGLSGAIYAYIAFIAPYVKDKTKFHIYVISFILVGTFIPGMAAGVHIYCYTVGLLYSYLNAPLCEDR